MTRARNAPFGRGRHAATVLSNVIDLATYLGSRVPVGLAHRAAHLGGTLEWMARPQKRAKLRSNLSHAVGDISHEDMRDLVRREFVNEARRSADLLWALGRPAEFLETVEYTGLEHAQRAVGEGGGLILASVHLGGWEVATAVPGDVLDTPTAVVVADDWLAWAIEKSRVTAGLDVLYPANAPLRAVRHLRAGGTLLVLGDDARWATRTTTVPFLDSHAELPAGVATLSRLSQSPVAVFAVLPISPRLWHVIVQDPLPAPAAELGEQGERAMMEALADRWSELIRTHPEHWAAAHPIKWV